MKYKQHRVMVKLSTGWAQAYQGTQGECRTFINAMRMADRKKQSPVITRRSVQEWLEQTSPHGSPAPSV